MRIFVAVPARGDPSKVLSAIRSLDATASGEHEIEYALLVDDDDGSLLYEVNRWDEMGWLPPQTEIDVKPRVHSLAARYNMAILEHPADVYFGFTDDLYCLTQRWDEIMALGNDVPAYCWTEANDPDNATIICLSEKWRAAIGRPFTEWFPYWFADTWIAEVHRMAFGLPLTRVAPLRMGGKRGKTRGMRELGFWADFFARTRVDRIQEAHNVAAAYGKRINQDSLREIVLKMEKWDESLTHDVPALEEKFGGAGDPHPLYAAMKSRAADYVRMAA